MYDHGLQVKRAWQKQVDQDINGNWTASVQAASNTLAVLESYA
jgi:hypothetical protein